VERERYLLAWIVQAWIADPGLMVERLSGRGTVAHVVIEETDGFASEVPGKRG
jgi:hypothetical protein